MNRHSPQVRDKNTSFIRVINCRNVLTGFCLQLSWSNCHVDPSDDDSYKAAAFILNDKKYLITTILLKQQCWAITFFPLTMWWRTDAFKNIRHASVIVYLGERGRMDGCLRNLWNYLAARHDDINISSCLFNYHHIQYMIEAFLLWMKKNV